MSIDAITQIIGRVMRPLQRKVLLMVGHGIIESVEDSKDIQFIQGTFLEGETKNNVRSFNHFGFSSNAPKDSECIIVSIGGNRDGAVVIATENREFRFKNLSEGNTVMFNMAGKYLHLKGDNLESVVEKIKIENENYEFISVLVEWFEEILISKNITGIGAQLMTPDSIAKLTVIKEKLKTFKV